MAVSSAIVLFAVIWFLCLFVALPIKIRSQSESGKVVRGTPPSAPADPMLKIKLKWTTVAAVLIWLPLAALISSGMISVSDIDIFGRWGDGQYG